MGRARSGASREYGQRGNVYHTRREKLAIPGASLAYSGVHSFPSSTHLLYPSRLRPFLCLPLLLSCRLSCKSPLSFSHRLCDSSFSFSVVSLYGSERDSSLWRQAILVTFCRIAGTEGGEAVAWRRKESDTRDARTAEQRRNRAQVIGRTGPSKEPEGMKPGVSES